MAKVTTTVDAVEIQRAKWAQQLTNKVTSDMASLSDYIVLIKVSFLDNLMVVLCVSLQYKYTDLAAKERAHFTQEIETPNMGHARKMKVVYSDVSVPLPHSYFISDGAAIVV